MTGVSNTGKFNYHLNILGDLIEKDENGRYCLSDKGRFAVQFLRRFEDGDIEPTPLPMFMKTFETRALSLAQGFIWVLLVYPLTWILFGWCLYFTNRAGFFVGDPTIPLMIFTMIIVAGFALFGMATFPEIKIDRDGVEVKLGFLHRFFSLQEIRIDSKGYVLKLGEGLAAAGWFILFKRKECMILLNKHVRTYQPKPLFLTYLLPVLVIGFYFELVKYLGGAPPPLFWAFSWGTTTAISTSVFVYSAPADMQIGNLHRGTSSMTFGLSTGIIIFLLMFFGLQIR